MNTKFVLIIAKIILLPLPNAWIAWIIVGMFMIAMGKLHVEIARNLDFKISKLQFIY